MHSFRSSMCHQLILNQLWSDVCAHMAACSRRR
jgi:hypothetical protein